MTEESRQEYAALAERMRAEGYRVITGYGKGGFWVRTATGDKPAFVNGHSFIELAQARDRFAPRERG